MLPAVHYLFLYCGLVAFDIVHCCIFTPTSRRNLLIVESFNDTTRSSDLKIDNLAFENVENFNYLGSILNADNKINIEFAERIAKGNKAYYANAKLIKPKFLKKNSKMKIYKTMIIPVVTYSSQTWTVTAKDENNISIFEWQILRKILGPINIDSIWTIRSNM